jgi:hypothetical protein
MSTYKFTREIINEKISNRGISLLGDYLGIRTYSTFKCLAGHTWSQRPMNVMRGQGCPHCSGNARLSKDIVNEKLKERDIIMIDEYINARTRSVFRCVKNHEWKATPDNVMRVSGCPTCAKYGFVDDKPAYVYLLHFEKFIKYGITNNIKSRLSNHRRLNGNFIVISTRLYENGKDAKKWENEIKNKFGGRYATKEECPDGYTETLSVSLLEEIKKYF